MHNKKAGIGLVEVFSFFFIIFIIMLFFIMLNLSSCGSDAPEQKIQTKEMADLKLSYDLNSYISTPITYEGNYMSVADMITLALDNEEHKEQLVDESSFKSPKYDERNRTTYLQTLDQYRNRDRTKILTTKTIDFMRTYADFVPAQVDEDYYCSINIAAQKFDKAGNQEETIKIFDVSYLYGLGNFACSAEFIIADTKIPSEDGHISVQMRSKFNILKLQSKIAATIALIVLPAPLPKELAIYYLWI